MSNLNQISGDKGQQDVIEHGQPRLNGLNIKIKRVDILFLLGLMSWLICQSAFAQTDSDTKIAVSVGARLVEQSHDTDNALEAAQATQLDQQAAPSHRLKPTLNDALTEPRVASIYTGMSREQIVAAKKAESKTQVTKVHPQTNAVAYYEFSIYDAYSRLFDDFNRNGFYQTFSVTFDADIIGPTGYEIANVYAEMYLSRNGGPWEHYYTTDIFTIEGQSSDDDYEVLTTLATGYRTDYYDVLIDLYEVGYSDVVATISADELDSLYALPLESADRDNNDGSVIVEAGSVSLWSVLALLMFVTCRTMLANTQFKKRTRVK